MKAKKSSVEQVTYNTLDNLLSGIYEAIVNAQKTVTLASMDMWRAQHFNKDNTPKTIKFQLPTGMHEIPTAILVNEGNIGIKDVEFEMEMRLDISAEIEKDLGRDRPLLWNDVKLFAVKRGWLQTGNEVEWGPEREAILIGGTRSEDNKYRLAHWENTIVIWKPYNGIATWPDNDIVIRDNTINLRENKAFRYWLDVNDLNPEDWGFPLNKKEITADSSSRGMGNMAKIKVTFEGKEAPEGIARINDVYVKTIPSS